VRATLRWGVTVAAVIVWIVTLLPIRAPVPDKGEVQPRVSPDTQKGQEARLIVYRKTPAGSEMLSDNDVTHAGDVIRLGYRVADAAYGAIVSIDGRGSVTVHLPAHGSNAQSLSAGELVLLEEAFELDAAPAFERFYLITARQPFLLQPVIDDLRRARSDSSSSSLPVSSSYTITTLSLRKDARP
jgi:hypothetical protein